MTVTVYLSLYPQDVYYDDERNNDCLASSVRHCPFHSSLLQMVFLRATTVTTTLPILVSHGYDPDSLSCQDDTPALCPRGDDRPLHALETMVSATPPPLANDDGGGPSTAPPNWK
jgi:hypothetical protein